MYDVFKCSISAANELLLRDAKCLDKVHGNSFVVALKVQIASSSPNYFIQPKYNLFYTDNLEGSAVFL